MPQFRLTEIHSAGELGRLLPGLIEEESYDTLVVNAARWESSSRLVARLRESTALFTSFDSVLIEGSHLDDVFALMDESCRTEQLADAVAHFAEETGGEEDAAFLWRASDRLARSLVPRTGVELAARRQWPRAGARELLASFPPRKVAIADYGFHAYLDYWSAIHRAPASHVYATRSWWRLHDDAHVFDELQPNTVVTRAKDRARADFELERRFSERDLLVLDGMPNALARLRRDGNVAVLFLPHRDPYPLRAAVRLRQLANPERFDAIDAILIGGSLAPLASMRRAA